MMNWIKHEFNFTFDIREAIVESVSITAVMIGIYFLIVTLAG